MTIVVGMIGVRLLVDGLWALAKGESKAYLGRWRRRPVTVIGPASVIVAGIDLVGGSLSVLASVAFLLDLVSFVIVLSICVLYIIGRLGASVLVSQSQPSEHSDEKA